MGWKVDFENGNFLNEEEGYPIPLGSCGTSAEVLDWIFHIRGKTWGRESLLELLDLMDETLDPQATLCSDGQEQGPVEWEVDSVRERVSIRSPR